jgi:hypothetical protein
MKTAMHHRHKLPRLACLAALALLFAGCARTTPDDPKAVSDVAVQIRESLLTGGGGNGGGSAVVLGTGWGTLNGTFTYNGTAPPRVPLNVDKDVEICAPGGGPVLDDVLMVDNATKGIANIVIYLRNANRVYESATAEAVAAEMPLFDQKQCLFVTHVQPIVVGQTLTLANSDPLSHNVKTEGGGGYNKTISPGASGTFQVRSVTSLPADVSCSIHPWMKGYLMAHDNAYVAVTGPDGKFEIPNLPAGEDLEFQAWHENAVGAGNTLGVDTPEARKYGWTSRGRFKVKLTEDGTTTLDIQVPAESFQRK